MDTVIWVFTGATESGDEVGPYAFDYEPTKKELQGILMADWSSEFDMPRSDWIDPHFGYISSHSLDRCTVRRRK